MILREITTNKSTTFSPNYKLINSCRIYTWNSVCLYVPGASGNGYHWIKLFKSRRQEQRQESATASLEYEFSGKSEENRGMRSKSCSVFVWFGFFPCFGLFCLFVLVGCFCCRFFFFKVLVERTQQFVGEWEKSILEAWPGTRATG